MVDARFSAVRAVLFDHDGTLVDSEPVHHAIWNAILQPYGFSLTLQEYEAGYAGLPTSSNSVELAKRFGMPQEPRVLAEAKERDTLAYLQARAFPLMPGVKEAITALRAKGLRLAVVTGAKTFAPAATLRWHGLEGHFETVVSADDVTHTKPAPDCYLLALERMGLQPHEAVALEDTEHGVASASAAGVACIALPTNLSAGHDFSKASLVLPNMAQAAAVLCGT